MFFLPLHVKAEQACNPTSAQKYFSISNLQAAYDALERCEYVDNLSGETYGRLAFLISYGYGKYSSNTERIEATLRLYVESAARDSEHGMNVLISEFGANNEFVNLQDDKVVDCLRALENKHGEARQQGVYSCVSPRYQRRRRK